jgi:outer membrane murein-binding lipoprotein Lpp
MNRSTISLAVAAAVTGLVLPLAVSAATVDELSAQLKAMQAQMLDMQKEIKELRAKDATRSQFEVVETDYGDLKEEVMVLREDVDDLDDRLMEPEKHAAIDGITWGGEFRFQAHSIESHIPEYSDGLNVQRQLIGALQDFGLLGDQFTYEELNAAVQGVRQNFPPAVVDGMIQGFAKNAYQPGYRADNDLLRTSRMRLDMNAMPGENVSFFGRLTMYKVWGDSTGVQVFNGQPTSINWDGTQSSYPNSDDMVHVDRAYFTWSRIAGTGGFLSIGRRPSTGGVPINFRDDEPRGGTPMGSLFNYQFDGITAGYHINDYSTLRICYGVGYESGWGNGTPLKLGSDQLDDATFYGLVWDIWDTPSMYIHAIAARAEDITDGFPGTTILPLDPLTGEEIPGAVPIRYEPTGTVGNMDLAGFVITRRDGPLDYFFSYGWVKSDPTNFTSPFGGMFTDPFESPESQDGDMYYLGARYNFNQDRTKFGIEYNHGSKYWYNFALSEDDFLAPKTSARGDVWETYLTHRIRERFIFKLAYIDYQYDYSGSGWLLGAPKDLGSTPILGFPTYDDASMWTVGLTARF